MERRRVIVFVYLAIAVVFLALGIMPGRRTTMVPLGIVFLVLALAQWKQRPRPGRR